MHLRGIIPIEFLLKPLLNNFKSFFFRVQLLISFGVFISIFIILSSWFYFYYSQTKFELQTQGITLTTNLSQNVEPFIIDFNKDQLNQFLSVMLDNPLVLFAGIINTHLKDPKIEVLQKQSALDLRYVSEIIQKTHYKQLINSQKSELLFLKNHIMFCISPIFSQFVFPDDESTILYGNSRNIGVIGYSFIAYQLPVKRIFSIPLKWLVPIFTVLVLLIGLFLGRFIANLLINRIQVIHRAIQLYSFGDSINIESKYNDEITDIARAINDLVALVNIHIDKTRRVNDQLTKRLEEQRVQLESENVELKDTNLMQRVIVAHAIQEIQQITDVLIKQGNKDSFIDVVLNHLSFFVHYMVEFIQDNQKLLKLTYVEKIDMYSELFPFKPFFEFAAKQKNNQFIMDVPKGIIIETNKVYFNQSIIQLILNACRYTSKGQVKLKVEPEKSSVLIEVSDNGVGIDQGLVDQTIDRLEHSNFQEIDTFSTLGLGVVGVHNFCKRIGATFICESQANKGTTIKILHPVLLKAKTDVLNKVTIVSNNEPNVKKIQAMIQKIKGWQCDIADNIELIANEQPRLAIIDLDHTPKPFKAVSSLIASQSECDFILLFDGKFIDVSLVLFSNDPNFYKTLIHYPKHNSAGIYLQGLSMPIENKVRDVFKGSVFYKTFSYSQSITLRIVSGEFYKSNSKEPVILITKSINELQSIVLQKGLPIASLVKYRLF